MKRIYEAPAVWTEQLDSDTLIAQSTGGLKATDIEYCNWEDAETREERSAFDSAW